jgi:hypothetical protein
MKERPILFSAPMVRAILDGTKTQTRRVVNPQPSDGWAPENPPVLGRITSPHVKRGRFGVFVRRGLGTDFPEIDLIPCPYGLPGDRLWVRETFYAFGRWETRFSAKKGRDEWHFVDLTLDSGKTYRYTNRPPQPQLMGVNRHSGGTTPAWWKRPAIHMPRAASRITLDLTRVRVERLQGISEVDAIAEGIEKSPSLGKPGAFQWCDYRIPGDPSEWFNCPIRSYRSLWESINGPGSWEANPWVWVVEFKRVQP